MKVESIVGPTAFESGVLVALATPTSAVLDLDARAADARERLGAKWICHHSNRVERIDGRRPEPRQVPEFLKVVK
jgi:nucleoside 2-deoxyribosyltransferase